MNLKDYIEHTLLRPDATQNQIEAHLEQALQYQFKGVCLNSFWIPLARTWLPQTIQLVSVVGFPLGANLTQAKASEAEWAVASGADEIDMVLNLGALKSGNFKLVTDDIVSVKKAISSKILKVIIETGLLTQEEKVKAIEIVRDSGADYIKTCTGFSQGRATIEDIELMKAHIGHSPLKIKASGGIRTAEQAISLIEAGASRLGTSQGVQILLGQSSHSTSY
jgi:deoxyribose-phosphate aldolase